MKKLAAGAVLFAAVALSNPSAVVGQSEVPGFAATATQDFSIVRWPREIHRFWQDYTLAAEDVARHVFVFSGTAAIDGQVERDAVVLLGDVRLGSTANIRHSLVVIGGNVTVAEGATVGGELIIVGGSVDAPSTFEPGGQHFVIGSPRLGQHLKELMRWVTWGLLWGRIIVFSIEWVWWILAMVFALSLVINVVFHRPVREAADIVTARPLNALLMGALLLVLTGPLIGILGASIIGLLVVPFAICAVFLAWSIGKVGVTRAVGMSVIGDTDPDSRFQALIAFLVGFVLITLIYAVPVLGFVAWAVVGLFGLGAAGLMFAAKLRREYPSRVKVKTASASPAIAVAVAAEAPPVAEIQVKPPRPEPAPVAVGTAFLPHATFLDRAAAFALDVILVAIATQFFEEIHVLGIHGDMVPLMLLIYHIAFWSWKGTTLGGIICRLRVVRTNGEPLRPIDAVVRGLTSIFSLGAMGIGCLWMLQDPNRQTWHDKAAGTYVLKVPKDWPLD